MDDPRARGFLDTLKSNPYDTTTRLIFADWLDEEGYYEQAMEERRKGTPEWVEADKFLHDLSKQLGWSGEDDLEQITFEVMMEAAETWLVSCERIAFKGPDGEEHSYTDGDRYTQYGSERARNTFYDIKTLNDFWKHYQIWTGKKVDETKQANFFSCSC